MLNIPMKLFVLVDCGELPTCSRLEEEAERLGLIEGGNEADNVRVHQLPPEHSFPHHALPKTLLHNQRFAQSFQCIQFLSALMHTKLDFAQVLDFAKTFQNVQVA